MSPERSSRCATPDETRRRNRADGTAPRRRAVPLIITFALLTAATAWPTHRATTAGATAPEGAQAAVVWLSDQLHDGTYQNPLAGGPDYGLMIDAVFAMASAGRLDLAAPILDVLDDSGGALRYASFVSFLPGQDADRVSGAVAKLLVAALVAGRDVHDFGGLDLVAETRAAVRDAGPEAGRIFDHGPNVSYDNSNTFGQILAVIGLAGSGARFDDVLARLLMQQCSAGYFRIFFSSNADGSPATCDQGIAAGRSPTDGDTTGFGLQALLVARDAGAGGLDRPIAAAADWLVAHQDPSGGWGGGVSTSAPNTNSTGLIVQALAATGGHLEAVARGEAYLRAAQVGDADTGTPLAVESGAIAYTPADHVAARPTGITSRDTWIRATAQAVLGLTQVGFGTLIRGGVVPPPTSVPTSVTSPASTDPTGTVPTASIPALPPTTVDRMSSTTASRPPAGPEPWSPVPDAQAEILARPVAHARFDEATTPMADAGGSPDRSESTSRTLEASGAASGRAAHATRDATTIERPASKRTPMPKPGASSGGGPPPLAWVLGAVVALALCVVTFKLASRPRTGS